MFLGPGGSGKSSLLDGLMNKPLRIAESTALADTLDIKYRWVEAADVAEDAWKAVTPEDEVEEMRWLCDQEVKMKSKRIKVKNWVRFLIVLLTVVMLAAGFVALLNVPVPFTEYNHNWVIILVLLLFALVVLTVYKWRWVYVHAVQLVAPVFAAMSTLSDLHTYKKYEKMAAKAHGDVTRSVTSIPSLHQLFGHSPSRTDKDVVMRIWDCGGQPVFLDILSAFLTKRTMFLLFFNAKLGLDSKYQEVWRHKGKEYRGEKQNITIHQLMMQWMQLIYASLVVKKESGAADKESRQGEATQDETTVEKREFCLPPQMPGIMIVGTHGDEVQPKEKQDELLKKLGDSCKNKRFQDILYCKMIIDNTTAGDKEREDPGYREIRKMIYDFTCSLRTPTPIAWVAFRKVLQKTTVDTPFFKYEEVVPIAETCGIPKEAVPSVLHFYHQLGVLLHYTNIKSLSTTIIADPQWLIQQLCKLILPEMYGSRPERLTRLWNELEGKGVLLASLYQEIWKDCGLRGGAQALVDLLEHFDLAKEITRENEEREERMYFVPCMLKARSQGGPTESTTEQPQETIRKAEALHITFSTEFVPPGFFVRLAARMINNQKCTLFPERGIYRDSITFCFGDYDRVTISESKSLESVQVDFVRVIKRTRGAIHFADSCLSFRSELSTMCKKTLYWFPSIKHHFAFKCKCSVDAIEHFTIISDNTQRNSQVPCRQGKLYCMNSGQNYWLQPERPAKGYVEDGGLNLPEIENVAGEIEGIEGHLAAVMEMEYSLEEARSGNRPAFTLISDYALREVNKRYKLAEYLGDAGCKDASTMLLFGHMKSKDYFETKGRRSLSKEEFSLKNIINALNSADFAAADWERLSVQLEQDVRNIRANRPDVESRLQEMISQWMRRDPSASWKKLAAALGKIPSYGLATASRLRQAIGLPSDQE